MKRLRPLINDEYEKLKWDKVFPKLNMIRIRTDADGSCFFHAIAKAYFKPYIEGKINDKIFDRKEFVRNLRADFSKILGSKVHPEDKNSKTYYEILNNGELPQISEQMPEYTLENMQKELNSSSPISNIYNEFISDHLGIDIYILDGIKKDVYMTGTDDRLLYKNRKSVVILYLPGHYELVGLLRNKGEYIETYFSHDSPFILKIRERMDELRT